MIFYPPPPRRKGDIVVIMSIRLAGWLEGWLAGWLAGCQHFFLGNFFLTSVYATLMKLHSQLLHCMDLVKFEDHSICAISIAMIAIFVCLFFPILQHGKLCSEGCTSKRACERGKRSTFVSQKLLLFECRGEIPFMSMQSCLHTMMNKGCVWQLIKLVYWNTYFL